MNNDSNVIMPYNIMEKGEVQQAPIQSPGKKIGLKFIF